MNFLQKKTVMFVIEGDYTFRIRQYKEALSLHEAGATVVFVCIGKGESQLWDNAPFSFFHFANYLGNKRFSHSKIRLLRIVQNLTYYRLLRKFDTLMHRREEKKLIKKAIEIKPDLVHAVDLTSLKVAKSIAQLSGAKLSYDSCDYWRGFLQNEAWSDSRAWANELIRNESECAPLADVVLVTGKTMRDQMLSDYGLARCEIIYNSIDVDQESLQPTIAEAKIRFVYHGAIAPDRNVDGLIRMFKGIEKWASLDIYGEFIGCERNFFIDLVKSLDLENSVNIFGRFSYLEMLEFLPKYDVGIYLAKDIEDNFNVTVPTKLFDYICSGLAVVMPRFRSISEELSGLNCGILVDTNDEFGMAQAIKKFVHNPSKIEEYKQASCSYSEKYCWTAQGETLINLYSELLKNR